MLRLLWTLWIPLSSILVSALPWIGPRETVIATTTARWSPAPTSDLELRDFFKREAYPPNLCGWQGPGYVGAYCSADSSCAWFTDITVVGCCSMGGSCDAVYTSCIDGVTQPTTSDPNVFTCTSKDTCYRNSYDSGYYQYGCGKTTKGEAVVTSYSGRNPQVSFVVLRTEYGSMQGPSTIESSLSVASITDSDTIESSTSTVFGGAVSTSGPLPVSSDSFVTSSMSSSSTSDPASIAQTSAADPSTSTHGSSLSTGAIIAIGVLAGVITLIALSFCIFFFCIRRRRKAKSKATTPTTMPSSPGEAEETAYAASQLIPELASPATKDTKDDPNELYDGFTEKQVKSDEGTELLDGQRENGVEVYEVPGDANWPVPQELHGEGDVRHEVAGR